MLSQASTEETHPFLNLFEKMTMDSSRDGLNLGDILERLPDRDSCDYLYSVFMCCVHPLTPYFHYPTFDKRYRQFWMWFEQWDRSSMPHGILADYPSFLPLLLAVLYYGAVVDPLVAADNHELSMAAVPKLEYMPSVDPPMLLALGTRALGIVDFPNKTTLASLTAFMLFQMDQLRCQDTSACSFVAIAVRIAQSMALHREDVNSAHDAVTAEERRRIWALLVHLDVLTARKSGLTPMLAQSSKLIVPLSEARDEYIGSAFADDARHAYPGFIVARGRYEASACVKPILVRQADGYATTAEEIKQFAASVKQLETNLGQRIARLRSMNISSVLPFSAPGLISVPPHLWARYKADTAAFLRWADTTLLYIIEQAYCDLFTLALADITVWDALRDE